MVVLLHGATKVNGSHAIREKQALNLRKAERHELLPCMMGFASQSCQEQIPLNWARSTVDGAGVLILLSKSVKDPRACTDFIQLKSVNSCFTINA